MRPIPGDDAWNGRQRSADLDPAPLTASTSNSQMSFFLADESSIDSYLSVDPESSNPHGRFFDTRKTGASITTSSLRRVEKDAGPARHGVIQPERDYMHSPASMRSQNYSSYSRPMTPIMLGTSYAGSAISSPSSRRNSFTGSLSEHAVSSDEEHLEQRPSSMLDSGSAPQLVMPSIKMPSRRPFTETGKSMGRVKVLLAGDSGVGKTSMVKAIVQICEHIVHVDPIPSQAEAKAHGGQATLPRRASNSTPTISEIYASTKPYPEWWSMLNDPHISERRKSLGDSVLERNVCFVDTPGYRNGSSAMEAIVPCVEYIESHLNRISSDSLSDSEMLNMLGGDGGFQVDVVFYLISQKMRPVDLEYIRRLSSLTNVIPILARADSFSHEQLAACKEHIASQLRNAGIQTFSFASAASQYPTSVPVIPYAVSSATGSDNDVMDASLLMSPDYVQPLITSELRYLVEQVFCPNGISWLRHVAAKKYLEWRSSSPSRPRHLYRPLHLPAPVPSSSPPRPPENMAGPWSQVLTCFQGQRQDQNPLRLRVADWASDLQRSLTIERARSEALADKERSNWIAELNGAVQDGTLVVINKAKGTSSMEVRKITKRGPSTKTTHHQDPLGLLQVAADLKAKGWVALEVIGSLGVIGGLAFWLSRQHWHMEPVQLADEWARSWGMDI